MATPRRFAELRASLERELESASQRDSLTPTGRLRWLRAEVENYLDRWLAFAAIESIPFESLLRDDLFAMVLAASDVYTREMTRCEKIAEAEWARFQAMLQRIRSTKDRSALPELRPALVAVGTALGARDS